MQQLSVVGDTAIMHGALATHLARRVATIERLGIASAIEKQNFDDWVFQGESTIVFGLDGIQVGTGGCRIQGGPDASQL
jgi:hypothetical protein